MTQHYRVKDTAGNRELGLEPGTIVEAFGDDSYGLKPDHEAFTGKPHTNVTPDGFEPCFCVPTADLEPVEV